MIKESYSLELNISVNPEQVFKAITKDIDKWWTEFSNTIDQAGDILKVQFEESTSWVMSVVEYSPNHSLVWEVTNAHHDLQNLTKKDEWKGTSIKWSIEENNKGSKVTLIHNGLVPGLECYDICASGWSYFLNSLKEYLETGRGNPFVR